MARVLVVEDEPIARELITSWLRRHGHEVSSAAAAEPALLLARLEKPQIAVIDWVLDGRKTGIDFAEQLVRGANAPKLMFCTAFSISQLRAKAAHIPGALFFSKPLSLERLSLAVDRALESCC